MPISWPTRFHFTRRINRQPIYKNYRLIVFINFVCKDYIKLQLKTSFQIWTTAAEIHVYHLPRPSKTFVYVVYSLIHPSIHPSINPSIHTYIHTAVLLCFVLLWLCHDDDVIQWEHFPRYWPFVRGIHRSPVNSPHKSQWRRALMFSLICAWINSWGWWFETPWRSLWRHCNDDLIIRVEQLFIYFRLGTWAIFWLYGWPHWHWRNLEDCLKLFDTKPQQNTTKCEPWDAL